MEQETQSFLATENVGKLMRQYAVPCIISLLVGALYNIVDQIFIANAAYLGSYGNAANTVVFPLTVIALAIAVMIGDGCCAFVSLSLGQNKTQDANRSVGNSIVLAVAAGIVLCVVYLVFCDPILTMFGGRVNQETFAYAREYFFYIALGIPFYMVGQALNPIIRADGSPKFAMVSTVAGAIVNTVLDPIFIFVFKWGMMGAAVATVIGQIVSAALALWYLTNTKTVQLSKAEFCLKGKNHKAHRGVGPLQLFIADFAGGGHGCHQQHDSPIRRAGCYFRPNAICPDSHGGGRHCDEVFSNCNFRGGRHGGGLHSHCRL